MRHAERSRPAPPPAGSSRPTRPASEACLPGRPPAITTAWKSAGTCASRIRWRSCVCRPGMHPLGDARIGGRMRWAYLEAGATRAPAGRWSAFTLAEQALITRPVGDLAPQRTRHRQDRRRLGPRAPCRVPRSGGGGAGGRRPVGPARRSAARSPATAIPSPACGPGRRTAGDSSGAASSAKRGEAGQRRRPTAAPPHAAGGGPAGPRAARAAAAPTPARWALPALRPTASAAAEGRGADPPSSSTRPIPRLRAGSRRALRRSTAPARPPSRGPRPRPPGNWP